VEITPPPLDMEPVWRDTLTALRGEMTPENYKRWLEPTTVAAFDGALLRVGVPDSFSQQWLDKRLRGAIERVMARTAPGVRVSFEVWNADGEAVTTEEALRAPPAARTPAPARASPRPSERLTIDRCAHCHYAPCRCPRKERRARGRACHTQKGEKAP